MKVLLSVLFLSLARSAFGGVTSFPTTDFPTIDETETSFPTTDIPTAAPTPKYVTPPPTPKVKTFSPTVPETQPDDVVIVCLDLTFEFSFAGGNAALFSTQAVGIIETVVDDSVQTVLEEEYDDVGVTVDNDFVEQYVVDSETVAVVFILCVTLDGSPEDRRRLIDIELPSVAEIVATVDETFDTPEKLVTFTEELKAAAEEEGVPDAFDDTEVTDTDVVKIPPSNPTAAPTPSTPCLDSTRDFLVNEVLQNCAWVAKEPSIRCAKGNGSAATHCQATCGKCGICNDAVKQFMTLSKGLHDCAWVKIKSTNQRCKEVGDDYTCRDTCGPCNNGSPCLDSTQRFLVNEIPRTCGWVAGAPDMKCLRGNVKSHCPVTCGACDEGCKNSDARFFVDGVGKYKTCAWVSAMDETNPGTKTYRCSLIGKDNGLSTCPEKCGFC